ncbi:MAG: MBL fold metallo-hydrolase [Promethearchaeota archaeon]
MNITFQGGAQEVGRSCIFVENKDTKVVLDAGVHLGSSDEDRYPYALSEAPDAVILTHAHLDHSGHAPALIKQYNCPIYATPVTQDMTELLVFDYLRLSKTLEESPYEAEDVQAMRSYAVDVRFRVPLDVANGQMILYRSGHLLGSAMVWLEIDGQTLLYTGDVNARHTRTLHQADFHTLAAETVIIESTYGDPNDRLPNLKKTEKEFALAIKNTLKGQGKVIIPAFAAGRAQQAMLSIEAYMRSGFLPEVPVYIDGMVRKMNEIYKLYWEWLRPEIRRQIRYTKRSPWESEMFHEVTSSERDEFINSKQPAIVITTSGMVQGGPVLRYLQELGDDERNLICLTGYMVEGTKGRALQEGERVLEIDGEKVEINAKVHHFEFSAHADQAGLMRILSEIEGVKRVIVVHGERQKAYAFSKRVKELKDVETFVPRVGETIEI